MKILILTCSTGEGHNSAAAALQEEFRRQGIHCETADALAFLSPRFSRFLCGAHTLVYRKVPRAFSAGYRLEEKHTSRRLFETVFRDTEKLRDFLRQGQFDAVISVHVFAAVMMTRLRRSGALQIPLFFVATDYTCSPGVGGLRMDGWFIPHEALAEEFTAAGVPRAGILPAGIPVRRCFYEKEAQSAARRGLGLPTEGRMVLLCCGSMGCGPMGELAAAMEETLPQDAFLVVICGTNETLRQELEARKLQRTYVVGFTAEMARYMDAADLYLTKAGGLSTTEALAKNLPLVYVDAVGGCESRNREFLLRRGWAVGAERNEDLPQLTAELLNNETQCQEMLRRRREAFAVPAAEQIVACVQDAAKGAEAENDRPRAAGENE